MPRSLNASAMDNPKAPHSVSLKVLRLSKPSLANQFPLVSSSSPSNDSSIPKISPAAALSYPSSTDSAFAITPLLTLPPSFGLAYTGETFSCTLCANNEIPSSTSTSHPYAPQADPQPSKTHKRNRSRQKGGRSESVSSVGSNGYVDGRRKIVSSVRIEAEMQTPGRPEGVKLDLDMARPYQRGPRKLSADEARGGIVGTTAASDAGEAEQLDVPEEMGAGEVELPPGASVQRIVRFDLREEGNHVLAVTVTYSETLAPAEGGSGEGQTRVRTFRKLYQFVAQQLIGVRTKAGSLGRKDGNWVLEAQLENLGDGAVSLEAVNLNSKPPFRAESLNWDVLAKDSMSHAPILKPHDVMQVMFRLNQEGEEEPQLAADGRPILGQLVIQWRSAMGDKGTISTGWLSGKKR
ncbi:MAG: hypothetical protein M1820_004872 [Bogoriella megaspora]|nr:MAG: hypothetical protein M1820_004872 [Bogoriella megaspora]